MDVATASLRQLSPADTYVYEFDWSPDGKQLAITSAKGNGDDNWYIASLSAIDANSGEMRDVQPKPGMQIANPRWSPDGKTIIFIGGLMSDEPIPGGDVYATDATHGPMKNRKNSMKNLTPNSKSTATSLTWLPNSEGILVTGIDAGETFVARLTLAGAIAPVWKGPELSPTENSSRTCQLRAMAQRPPWCGKLSPTRPRYGPAQWRLEADHARECQPQTRMGRSQKPPLDHEYRLRPRLAHLSEGFRFRKKISARRLRSWRPRMAYTPKFPSRWNYPFALPERGFFILEPNPRGSYGMGEKFTQANVKDFGYGDILDIMA